MDARRPMIEEAYRDATKLDGDETRAAIRGVLDDLDGGRLRVATPDEQGEWTVHSWIQQAIVLYFRITQMEASGSPPFQYHDQIGVKVDHANRGVRVVPPATARYGSFIEPGAVLLPCYVNIGAYVGAGTMVDTWATVGSAAQIGRDVHIAGGVGIGGVLEPPGERPVIIEDGSFIGSRSILVEGIHVRGHAVIAAGTVLTASTPIIDVRGDEERISYGEVPRGCVVVPGVRKKRFPAGEYGLPCALLIGERSASTDRKTALNEALRSFRSRADE